MKFRAKLDDAESRDYWDSVRKGAREYDDLPAWRKGNLGGVDSTDAVESAEADDDSRGLEEE
jgi:hypothetical protein